MKPLLRHSAAGEPASRQSAPTAARRWQCRHGVQAHCYSPVQCEQPYSLAPGSPSVRAWHRPLLQLQRRAAQPCQPRHVASAHGSGTSHQQRDSGLATFSSVGAPHSTTHTAHTVAEVLSNLRQALGTSSGTTQNSEVVMSGVGRHLGINIKWRMRWRADGAFHEQITGRELSFSWGYDGLTSSSCWEVDSSGVARSLECDDHEALLVGAWVRTGLWLQPHLSERLDIRLEEPPAGHAGQAAGDVGARAAGAGGGAEGEGEVRRKAASGGCSEAPQDAQDNGRSSAASPAGTDAQQASATQPASGAKVSSSNGSSGSSKQQQRAGGGGGAKKALLDAMMPGEDPPPLVLLVRLVGGKVVNRVRVCPLTWEVQGLDQPLCGDTEVWQFGSWKAWQPEVMYPEHVSHQAIAGGHHVYVTQSCATCDPSPRTQFQCPNTPVLPADTSFAPDVPPELPVWRAGSGHLLVKPRINGKEGGYMVVDTGASGFVITPDAAVALGLDTFGELFAAGIAGKIPAQFVKARSWSLGPLNIASPVMMTMPLDGLVRGGPPGGDVIGIVGYDIFRRAVIELPQMTTVSHATPAPHPPASTLHHSSAGALNGHPTPAAVSHSNHGNGGGLSPHHGNQGLGHGSGVTGTSSSDDEMHPQGEPVAASSSTQGTSQQAAGGSGPLPFLQGLINAASAGLMSGGPPWGTGPPAAHATHSHGNGGESATAADGASTSASTMATSGSSPSSSQPAIDPSDGPSSSTHSSVAAGVAASSSSSRSKDQPASPFAVPGTSSAATAAPSRDSGGRGNGCAASSGQGASQAQAPSPSFPGGCQQYVMRLYNPDEYQESEGWCWHPFRMIASLPHIEVALMGSSSLAATTATQQRHQPDSSAPASSSHGPSASPQQHGGERHHPQRPALSVLLMLDSGACGADIMLHARAMRELDLHRLSRPTSHFVRGVGGASSDHGVKIEMVDLEWVELAGVRFREVRCMHAGVGGLDISLYSAGILCGDLLTRLPTCYDYARKRMGFKLPQAAAGGGGGSTSGGVLDLAALQAQLPPSAWPDAEEEAP